MVLCKYFASGSCKFGNRCNFEHVLPNQNKWGTSTGQAATSKYHEASIKLDLTDQRPQWKLSVYGPAKEEPNLLVGVDRSPEEDRLLYYTSMKTTGNNMQYLANYDQSLKQVESQYNAIVNNPQGAIQHYEKEKASQASLASTGPFGNPTATMIFTKPFTPFTGGSAFGAAGSSAFGQQAPAFGQQQSSAFGQPSGFGKPSAFGQSSAFGQQQQTTSAFSNPSAFGGTASTAFGQPSAFGVAATSGTTTAFGQPSAFGTSSLVSNTSSAFGQPSAFGSSVTNNGSAFGQPSAFGSLGGNTNSNTGTSAFGALASNNTTTSAFGKPSTFGQTAAAPSSTMTGTPAFGQPSAFGAPSAFGSSTQSAATSMSSSNDCNNEMKQSDIEAFSAPQFLFGKIPEVEPPANLC